MRYTIVLTTLSRICGIFFVTLLLCSFSLHAVQISHHHFGEDHARHGVLTIDGQMHLMDKKLIFILAAVAVTYFSFLRKNYCCKELIVRVRTQAYMRKILDPNYFCVYFKNGVLHPKIFSYRNGFYQYN